MRQERWSEQRTAHIWRKYERIIHPKKKGVIKQIEKREAYLDEGDAAVFHQYPI